MKILSEGGIRGLWAGWVPNVQRAALVNMGGKLNNLACGALDLKSLGLKGTSCGFQS